MPRKRTFKPVIAEYGMRSGCRMHRHYVTNISGADIFLPLGSDQEVMPPSGSTPLFQLCLGLSFCFLRGLEPRPSCHVCFALGSRLRRLL